MVGTASFEEPESPADAQFRRWLASKVDAPLGSPSLRLEVPEAAPAVLRLFWEADGKKLRSNERQVVSPAFELPLSPPTVFKMVIVPSDRGSFRSSKGRGRIQVKCEEERTDVMESRLRFRVMPSPTAQAPRPEAEVVQHDFHTNGVSHGAEEWDFMRIVGHTAKTLSICLELFSLDVN
jgi:hypothetical protein